MHDSRLEACLMKCTDPEAALGERRWLVGESFTIADLMVASVLKIARSLDLLMNHTKLTAYQDRCFDRPAYQNAIAQQCAAIDRHHMADICAQ